MHSFRAQNTKVKVKAASLFSLAILSMIALTSCGNSGSSKPLPSKIVSPLTGDQVSSLKQSLLKTRKTYDQFSESLKFSASPDDECFHHNVWTLIYGEKGATPIVRLVMTDVDDVLNNIAEPAKLVVKSNGKFSYYYKSDKNWNSVSCGDDRWEYISSVDLTQSQASNLLSAFKDSASLFRVYGGNISGYRDVPVSTSDRSKNIAILESAIELFKGSITMDSLK